MANSLWQKPTSEWLVGKSRGWEGVEGEARKDEYYAGRARRTLNNGIRRRFFCYMSSKATRFCLLMSRHDQGRLKEDPYGVCSWRTSPFRTTASSAICARLR